MLSLESMSDPARAKDMRLAVNLRPPDGEFTLLLGDGRLNVAPARVDDPDCVVTGDQNAHLSVHFARKPVTAALADGALVVEGDTEAFGQLAGAFRDLAPLTNRAEGRRTSNQSLRKAFIAPRSQIDR
ncbi:SCP2 sterol-binding domain-containing protein [Limimaricola variabilis]